MAHQPGRQHRFHPSAPWLGARSRPQAPARATTLHVDARMRTQRHEPQPRALQPQEPTLAEILGGVRHEATTAGLTDIPGADRTQAITDIASRALPGLRDPETHPEARTTGNTGAPPTPPASPRRGNRRRTPGRAPGGGGRQQSRRAGLAACRATVLGPHLAVSALRATPSAGTGTPAPSGPPTTRDRTINRLRDTVECRPGTDGQGPGEPHEATPGAHPGDPTGDANPAPPTTVGDSPHNSPAADPGPDARAPPVASPETADTVGGGTLPTGHLPAGGRHMYRPDNRGHRTGGGWRSKDHANSPRSPG